MFADLLGKSDKEIQAKLDTAISSNEMHAAKLAQRDMALASR